MIAIVAKVTLLTNFGLRRSFDRKIFFEDLGDHPIKVGAGRLHLGRAELDSEGAHHNHRELQPFRLMNGHHLNMAFGEGLVGVFILVDPTLVEEPQEAMEEVKSERLTVPGGDNGVVVVVLEDVQELREGRQVTRPVLIL
jgi:hypothetical protein